MDVTLFSSVKVKEWINSYNNNSNDAQVFCTGIESKSDTVNYKVIIEIFFKDHLESDTKFINLSTSYTSDSINIALQ